jgi:excisionase family DNA binding protein
MIANASVASRRFIHIASERSIHIAGIRSCCLPRLEPSLDTQQAAALLGIHPKTLQKLLRAGTVPCHRIGDLSRFRASELDTWLLGGINSKPPLVP